MSLGRAEGGEADGAEAFARFPTTPFSQSVWTGPLVRLGLFQRQEPAVFAPLPRWSAGHGSPRRRGCEIQFPPFSQKVDQGRRPRRLRSTRRAGVGRESRRALCWHRPPVLYPRGATRAKLCKCCQGQTPQNFDRVLAAACLYRDMLIVLMNFQVSEANAPKDSTMNDL